MNEPDLTRTWRRRRELTMFWVVVALIGTTVFLLLAVLGSMRETVLLRGQVLALSQLVQHPPLPSFIGERAPEMLVRAIEDSPLAAISNRPVVVAVVSPGCRPCEDLVDGISTAAVDNQAVADGTLFVIWASNDDLAERFAPRVPGPYVLDGHGTLARACEVRATPTVFIVSPVDYTVVDCTLEGDPQWVINRLTFETPVVAALR